MKPISLHQIDIDYINDRYELGIELGEEYESLGGFIIHHLASIPEAGTRVEINDLTFTIEEVSGNRIDVIRLEK